jgi:hypothetical protein
MFAMICGYQNINDYCLNKFTYQYASIPTATSGDLTTSVIRTDKDSGEVVTIGPNTDLYVLPCDNNDLVEVISAWECYQIFVNNNNLVSKVDTSIVQNNKQTEITNNYDLNLQDSISINLDNFNTIMLDSSTENQIHLGNIFCLANILYNEDVNSVMPYILDINNIAYYFSYNDLKSLLKTYFYKVAKVKNIKDDLLFQVSADTNSEDINSKSLCKNKVAVNIFKENKSIDISTYKNPILVSLPPEICDPPCDPANCESCVNGECIGSCPECESNTDCGYCTGMIGPFQQYTQCDPPTIGAGCQDCDQLELLCSELGGSYSRTGGNPDYCSCSDIVLLVGTEENCIAANTQYNGSFTFEQGYCCDNLCQTTTC